MAQPLTKATVLFRQRLLASAGLYRGDLDGLWSPQTDAAERAAERHYQDIRAETGAADPRSEDVLRGLAVPAQRPMRRLLAALSGHGWVVRLISGTRSYAEQDALYAQGRTAPGKIVTNARPGQSWHNFGLAVDIGIFDGTGKYQTAAEPYRELGAIGRALDGIEWGGSWPRFPDFPHFQVSTGLTITEARKRFEAGEPLLPGK